MAIFLFADNARSTLNGAIGPSTTSITLAPGGGAVFPSPGANQQFALTFNDQNTGTIYETCYCTARSGDTLTIVRGQEGTTAKSWSIGDFAFCGPTSGQQNSFVQYPHMTDASIAPVFSTTVIQGNEQVTGSATVGNGLTATSGLTAVGWDANGASWRTVTGSYGAIFRNDGATAYFLSTAAGGQYGTWNAYRPFYWALGSGAVTIDGTGAGVTCGGGVTVNGNTITHVNTFFGANGVFYAGPNGANSLLNFNSGQYIQFIPGYGTQIVGTGRLDLDAPSGTFVSTSLSAAQNLSASGSVFASVNVQASNAVTAGGNVAASQSVTAGVNVIANSNVYGYNAVVGGEVLCQGAQGAGNPGFYMFYDGTGSPSIAFVPGARILQQIGTNWYYWVNTGGTPTMALSEQGILTTYGYTTFSDERTKQGVEPFTYGLDTVLRLEPISYYHNGRGGTLNDGRLRHGLSAQQVREHLPEAVTETAGPPPLPEDQEAIDGLLLLEDKPIMMAMLNAIKEIAARLDALEARL